MIQYTLWSQASGWSLCKYTNNITKTIVFICIEYNLLKRLDKGCSGCYLPRATVEEWYFVMMLFRTSSNLGNQ